MEVHVSLFDLKRLESYSKNLVDFHLIMDLVPTLARLYFTRSHTSVSTPTSVLPKGVVNLSYIQSAIMLGLGLQHKNIDQL